MIAVVTLGAIVAGPFGESGGGAPASATAGLTAPAPGHVVARPGDTLWAIAEEHHGEHGFDDYLDALIEVNGGTAIDAGQLVVLP